MKNILKLGIWIVIFLLPYLCLAAWRAYPAIVEAYLPVGFTFVPVWFLSYFIIGIVIFGIGFVAIEKRASDYLLAAGGLLTLGIVTAFFLLSLWRLVIVPLIY